MKILTIFGTRPEAIKMAPVVDVLKSKFGDDVKVCVTAQHRQMLDQVLTIFNIRPDYDLDIMQSNQSLSDVTCYSLLGLEKILKEYCPDRILVHGDTTTTLTASLAGYYQKIPVDHVEAGLRTHNPYAPWPEEMNRRLTACLANLHFAPTALAAENLLREGIDKKKIFITGNTVVDALIKIRAWLATDKTLFKQLENKFNFINPQKKLIFVTGHRRENFGNGMENICVALLELAKRNDVEIIYPVHLNPNVQNVVNKYLKNHDNIFLIEPQDYLSCVFLMEKSYLILTDSGGIQEEAPTFGKPVLIMRDITERPEAVLAGISKVVGTNPVAINREANKLLNDQELYSKISEAQNPFGDGHAARRIVETIMSTSEIKIC